MVLLSKIMFRVFSVVFPFHFHLMKIYPAFEINSLSLASIIMIYKIIILVSSLHVLLISGITQDIQS